jgi:hypothetical protein
LTLPKLLETVLGLIFLFYMLKGLLGKFRDGELTKALVALTAWLALVGFNSGLLKGKPLNASRSEALVELASSVSCNDAET